MPCPYCAATATTAQPRRTALGYRTFRCDRCRRIFNERTGTPYNHLQVPTDLVVLVVLWRLRYTLRLRDLATDRRKPLPPLAGEGGAVAACREAHALLASGGAGERRLLGGSGYEWLDAYWRGTRIEDNLRRRLRQAFERVGERCLAEGCYETVAQLLALLFEEDYTDQEIARKLLLAYGQLGDRASVLHVDRMLRQALKRTLFDGLTARERIGITEDAYAPARETRLLVERLLNELAGKEALDVEVPVPSPALE